MKRKTTLFIFGAAVAAFFASCSSGEDIADNENKLSNGQVRVSIEASMPSSRTLLTDAALTGGMTQTWNAADAILVVCKNPSSSYKFNEFTKVGTQTDSTATFTGTFEFTLSSGAPLYVYYPSNLSYVINSESAVTVDYNSQGGTLEDVQSRAAMCAYTTYQPSGTTIGAFKNAGAILRFKLTFPENVNVKQLILQATNLKKKDHLTATKNGPSWSSPITGSMMATLSTSQAFTASTPGYLYMASLPQTGLKNIVVKAITDNGDIYEKTLSATGVDFVAGNVYTLNTGTISKTKSSNDVIMYDGNETPVEPTRNSGVYEISTAANFKWLCRRTTFASTDSYKLMKDVMVMPNVEWSPINSFKGIFDGNGKTVSGVNHSSSIVPDAGFFDAISDATVKNLTVQGTTLWASSHLGGIACKATNSTISGCTVKFDNFIGSNRISYAGGICGEIAGGNIYGCTVEIGNFNGSSTAANCGGIVGYVNRGVNIMTCLAECTFSGSIYVGGIVGSIKDGTAPYPYLMGCLSNSIYNITATNLGKSGGIIQISNNFVKERYTQLWYYYKVNLTPSKVHANFSDLPNTGHKATFSFSDFNSDTFISALNASSVTISGTATTISAQSGFHFVKNADTSKMPTIVANP